MNTPACSADASAPDAIPRRFRSRVPGGTLVAFRRDPLRFLRHLALDYGDVVQFPLGRRDVFLINDPELIRAVLITNDRRFSKGPGLRVAERLLGQGLLTSEGEYHRRQRRLAQPAFHHRRLGGYARVMADYSLQQQRAWADGATLDMAEEMRGLTLRIAAKTLFDTEVAAEIEEISEALTESLRLYGWATLPFAARLEPFLPFLTRRFDRARARLDATVYRMIAERHSGGDELADRGDLLSLLMLARDEDDNTGRMSDQQLRDEAMTILLAGHETTANALAWTWYLLSQNPEAEAGLHAEVDAVLGGRLPALEDVPKLPYTRRVFSEAMRCFPPAWIIARRALQDCPLGGAFTLPSDALVLMSPWVLHHDPRHYPDPFRFDPDRWTAEAAAQRPRFAYFPFGGGSRTCIGEQFAWMEGVLALATLAASWQFRLVPGHRVVALPSLTLRPQFGVRMLASRRHLKT